MSTESGHTSSLESESTFRHRYRLAVIIDDDPINNLICENLLRKSDLVGQTRSFAGGAEALAWLETQPPEGWPDLILLDINMPGMSGWEFLERVDVARLLQHVRVYILSSSVSQKDMAMAEAHELVSAYLVKPLKLDELAN